VDNCAAAPTLGDLTFAPSGDSVKSCVFQIERAPTTQKLHMQGFIQFTTARAMGFAKKLIGNNPHLELMKGTVEEAVAYCRKDESRVCGPYLIGEEPAGGQGKRTDLDRVRELVKERKPVYDMLEEDARFAKFEKAINMMRFAYMEKDSDRQEQGVAVKVFFGATGLGKTYSAINHCCANKDYYIAECPSQKGSKLWFNGYEGQRTLILDDFSGDYCSIDFLKRLLDKYKLKVEFKGGFVWACWTTVIITTNSHPSNWYSSLGTHVVNVGPLRRRINVIYEFLEERVFHEVDWDGKSVGDTFNQEWLKPENQPAALPPRCTTPDLEDTQVVSPPPKKRKLIHPDADPLDYDPIVSD